MWCLSFPSSPLFPRWLEMVRVFCIVSVALNFLPGWVASPPRNPPPLSWLGTGADSARRFYMQNLWRSTIIYMHTYTYIHIQAYIHIHLYVCMRVYYVCMYVYIYYV